MYIYENKPPGLHVGHAERPVSFRLPQRNSYYFDRTISGFLVNRVNAWANEGLGQLTIGELSNKLNYLSFLPHSVEVNDKDLPLTPAAMDPGIYDGAETYKIAPTLQGCLKTVMAMENGKFRHIKLALVDLTKNVMQPEFAASFDHKVPVFAASVPKIAAMLGAYQLRHDLRVASKQKPVKTLDNLFDLVHNDWADTQRDPKTKATPFTRGVSCLGTPPCRGKLVLVQGQKIALNEPKAPRLKDIFANAVPIDFKSTGENKATLKSLINQFNQGFEDLHNARKKLAEEKKKGNAMRIAEARRECAAKLQEFEQKKAKINALGFLQRMRVMTGGLVPASNFATSTIIRDVGYLYIASTLLQSGLYDTNRNGGSGSALTTGVDVGTSEASVGAGLSAGVCAERDRRIARDVHDFARAAPPGEPGCEYWDAEANEEGAQPDAFRHLQPVQAGPQAPAEQGFVEDRAVEDRRRWGRNR